MRVAQIATLGTPVREEGAGSIEGLVWTLAKELTALGHEVTTFAAGGSSVSGELVETLPGPYATDGSPDDWQLCEWINLCRAIAVSGRFDVVHSHAYLWSIPLEPLARAPMIHTLHVVPGEDDARLWSMASGAWVTALSRAQWDEFPVFEPAAVIPHGIDPASFTFRESPDEYVCYLGRFTHEKGPRLAISAARELGIKLVLAGPWSDYYRDQVAPLVDGRSVEYVGPVGTSERDRLLGGARALLYPVLAPEPFGLVLIEAMMCGTPVVASPIGAVSEVLDEGVTGFAAASPGDFAGQIERSLTLDRRLVRAKAEERFTAARMARDYARVYERRIRHWSGEGGRTPRRAKAARP
jgi:glycosyltransferase involved in cell wall biosynthesis